MSGICGILRLDGAPAEGLEPVARHLERRGPDGTHLFRDGPCALGHTALNTTPESLHETLPLTHRETGCTLTADLRLDNREELIAALGLPAGRVTGDGEIVLHAWLKWGEDCPLHLLGDFAFAIWDPRKQQLFCARDQMGMKQLIHCHVPGRVFALASEPKAVLKAPDIPRRINEGRIADFLENYLEGIDYTSTFFEEVFRLPPAHCLTVSANRFDLRRYWRLEPGPELKLGSDRECAEAFLEVFTESVRSRLRVNGPVGSMLSGGMDSGSVVAVAARLLAAEGRGPLHTFSAIGPDPESCVETRTIHASLAGVPGLAPHMVNHDAMEGQAETLRRLTRESDEPFDGMMAIVRLVYDLARRADVRVVLDGVAGDVALSPGSRTAHLFRQGRWRQLWREVGGQVEYWGFQGWTRRHGLREALRAGLAPDWMRRLRLHWQARSAMLPKGGLLDPDLARRVDLAARWRKAQSHGLPSLGDLRAQRAASILHPNLTVGRERYDRLAAAAGVEPRDPFMDIRLLSLCLSLPADQAEFAGWPKPVLRRAMAGLLPEATIRRPGKQHLGAMFTWRMLTGWQDWRAALGSAGVNQFVNPAAGHAALYGQPSGDLVIHEHEVTLFYLANWLIHNQELFGFDWAEPK